MSIVEEKLDRLKEIELGIVSLLTDSVNCINLAQKADENREERKEFVLCSKSFCSNVINLKSELKEFIDSLPVSDYPRINRALIEKHKKVLNSYME